MKTTEAIFIVLILMGLIGLIPVFILGKNNSRKTSVIVQNIAILVISLISLIFDYAVVQYILIIWWVILFFYSAGGREKSLWVSEN